MMLPCLLTGLLSIVLHWELHHFEPVTTGTALGLSLVQVHPMGGDGVLLTYTAHQPLLIHGRDQCGLVFSSFGPLSYIHSKRILITSYFGQEFKALDSNSMPQSVWHGHLVGGHFPFHWINH